MHGKKAWAQKHGMHITHYLSPQSLVAAVKDEWTLLISQIYVHSKILNTSNDVSIRYNKH